jgi:hypothetical protein
VNLPSVSASYLPAIRLSAESLGKAKTSTASGNARPSFAEASERHFSFRFGKKSGGADRDQTDDLVVANDALYQLSYCPESGTA